MLPAILEYVSTMRFGFVSKTNMALSIYYEVFTGFVGLLNFLYLIGLWFKWGIWRNHVFRILGIEYVRASLIYHLRQLCVFNIWIFCSHECAYFPMISILITLDLSIYNLLCAT